MTTGIVDTQVQVKNFQDNDNECTSLWKWKLELRNSTCSRHLDWYVLERSRQYVTQSTSIQEYLKAEQDKQPRQL